MSRSHGLYLRDIEQACDRLRTYGAQIDWAAPDTSRMALDAVLYNLLIVGEAAKNVPAEVRAAAAEIEWRRIAGIRDVLAHGDFTVDLSIVRDVLEHKLQPLQDAARRLLADERE